MRLLRSKIVYALIASSIFLCACRLNDSAPATSYLKVEGNAKLLTYSRVAIVLGDTTGNMIDTLYNDSVPSLNALNRLPSENYQGGKAKLSISGYRKNILAYSEMRLYDGKSQSVLSLEIIKSDEPTAASVNTNPTVPPNPTLNPPTKLPSGPGTDTAAVAIFHTPSFLNFPRDTTVSIRDSVLLLTEVSDPDGDLAKFNWACKMEGAAATIVDTGLLMGASKKIPYGKRFKIPGLYVCQLNIWDKGGRTARRTDSIQVLLDPPRASAGADTIVFTGTKIFLNAIGDDNYDPIITRGWKIGDEPFKIIPQQETTILAPTTPQDLICILTVMDADSLTASDTLIVKVVAP